MLSAQFGTDTLFEVRTHAGFELRTGGFFHGVKIVLLLVRFVLLLGFVVGVFFGD
jgi:hypothetical protein